VSRDTSEDVHTGGKEVCRCAQSVRVCASDRQRLRKKKQLDQSVACRHKATAHERATLLAPWIGAAEERAVAFCEGRVGSQGTSTVPTRRKWVGGGVVVVKCEWTFA